MADQASCDDIGNLLRFSGGRELERIGCFVKATFRGLADPDLARAEREGVRRGRRRFRVASRRAGELVGTVKVTL